MTSSDFERARRWIGEAQRVVVLSGAGISTGSGIPDFRGPQGVWTKDPHAEMLSNYETWISSTKIRRAAWQSRVAHRFDVIEPNDGHRALLALEVRGALQLLVTQNIDGLHHRAGTSAELIVEIHGSARDSLCLACGHRQPIELTFPRILAGDDDPTCWELIDGQRCDGMLKSATISFGQSLIATDLARAETAARRTDLLLAVGSTLAVYPVAQLVPTAKSIGARVVIVNGGPTAMDEIADATLSGDISEVLPALLAT